MKLLLSDTHRLIRASTADAAIESTLAADAVIRWPDVAGTAVGLFFGLHSTASLVHVIPFYR